MFIEGFLSLDTLINDKLLTLITIVSLVLLTILWFLIAKFKVKTRNSFAIYATVLQLAYLIWRIGFTIPANNVFGLIFAVALILAEILGFIQVSTYRLLFSRKPNRYNKNLSDLDNIPSVDIMITTYNEPEKVIRRTVAAASGIDYPKDKFIIYVCDDGSRNEIKKICDEYGAKWITRKTHEHAKAGNLNNCYNNHSTGEYSVILDADMVPKKDFLQKTLGYFDAEDVAFVQTPQTFFNPDVFQRNLRLGKKIPNEQEFFMREVQTQRQEFNALLFVGSGCVFRRTHLESIGFIPTGTITEDMATSLLLQSKGYKGILVKDTFAQGLSAESFADHISQRSRWAQGNIEVLKKWNPWKYKTLNFMQKLTITDGVLYWFFGVQKMIYILCPLFFVFTKIPILKAELLILLVLWLPNFIANILNVKVYSHDNRTWGWAHIYETSLAPYLALAAIKGVFSKKQKVFKVTPKGTGHGKVLFSLSAAMPHLVLIALSLVAIAIIVSNLVMSQDVYMKSIYLLNGFWIIYNLFALIISVLICIEQPRIRQHDRLEINKTITMKIGDVELSSKILNISEGGCKITPLSENLNKENFSNYYVDLTFDKMSIRGRIIRYISDENAYAVKFVDLNSQMYEKLVEYIFSNQSKGFGKMENKSLIKALLSQTAENFKQRKK